MTFRKTIAAAFAALTLCAPASAATVVFQEDFDAGKGAFTGSGKIVKVAGYADFDGFSGRMLRNTSKSAASRVSLDGLAPHKQLTISFSLALIDSWDGPNPGRWGPDFFNVSVDGTTVLTASNGLEDDALTFLGHRKLGFSGRWADRAYLVSFDVTHTGDTADLAFFASGSGYQGAGDESWGIDNLVVAASGALPSAAPAIPLPASLGLLLGAMGLSGLFLRLRRRSAG